VSVPAGRIATVTTARAHRKRGLLLSLLTLLTLIAAILTPLVDVSASTRTGVETRVRAIDTPTAAAVATTSLHRQQPSGSPATGYDNRRRLPVLPLTQRLSLAIWRQLSPAAATPAGF